MKSTSAADTSTQVVSIACMSDPCCSEGAEFPTGRCASGSESVWSTFSGSNPDQFLQWLNPDLAVADRAGPRRIDDRFDYVCHLVVENGQIDTHLRDEIHLVLSPPVDLGVAALASESRASATVMP